jgi:hypothetical protein
MPVPSETIRAVSEVKLLMKQPWRILRGRMEFFPSSTRPPLGLARIHKMESFQGPTGGIVAFVWSDGRVCIGSNLGNVTQHNSASLEEAIQFINTLYELGEI